MRVDELLPTWHMSPDVRQWFSYTDAGVAFCSTKQVGLRAMFVQITSSYDIEVNIKGLRKLSTETLGHSSLSESLIICKMYKFKFSLY